jgi:alpha-galactosidase
MEMFKSFENSTKNDRRDFLKKSLFGASALGLSTLTGLALDCENIESGLKQGSFGINPSRLTPKPPLGWNSYDCFLGDGTKFGSANEWTLMENLEVFAAKLKPAGYEYFVLDCRWFSPTADGSLTRLDEYGRSLPSESRFPNGFKPIVDRAHKLGIKFGIHLIRGIPKKAVQLNLPVKGTKYRAKDIMSTEIEHRWDVMDSVDLDKPGSQEYYNSVLNLLAEWQVDFVKYDEIEHYPRDIEAVAKAISQCKRDIVLSISPGDLADLKLMDVYKLTSNMLRICGDVWDRREDIEKVFIRWEEFQSYGGDGFWLDFDMIPFGHLLVPYPNVRGVTPEYTGYERMDNFTREQKQSFMTQRALGASPLFMGGNLPTTDDLSFQLLTNSGMLECNQNGIIGKLASRNEIIDVWKTPRKDNRTEGWIGIFNRSETSSEITLAKLDLGLDKSKSYKFHNIWEDRPVPEGLNARFPVDADGVVFLKYAII